MKALILAAGEGSRLRPLTLDRPKPMLPVGDRPLLEHLILWLRRHGIVDIALNLHHQPQAITRYFGDGLEFGVSLTYSHEETLLGTAGAARRLLPFLDQPFVLVYGDVFTNLDLARLIAFHNHHKEVLAAAGRPDSLMTLALYPVDNPTACGIVDLDEHGRITRFLEKPPPDQVFSDLANAGILVIEPNILGYIPDNVSYDFGHDLIPQLLAAGVPMAGLPIPPGTYLRDIGTPEGYAQAQQIWQEHCNHQDPKTV